MTDENQVGGQPLEMGGADDGALAEAPDSPTPFLMQRTDAGIWIGSLAGCQTLEVMTTPYVPHGNRWWATVHACKHPCYFQKVGKVEKGDPNYLWYEDGWDCYLNLIDADRAPKNRFVEECMATIFGVALDFIARAKMGGRHVFVHCNEGFSRAPTIALLYMAKRMRDVLPNETFSAAWTRFQREFFPEYAPGKGIVAFLEGHWDDIPLVT